MIEFDGQPRAGESSGGILERQILRVVRIAFFLRRGRYVG